MEPLTIQIEDALGPLTEREKEKALAKLFAAGDLTLLKRPRVSVIGSRRASTLGLGRAAKLARLLTGRGVVVVSGLAKGIDTAAHRAAIDCGGQTIAVLGTPLDEFYPKENRTLQEHIASYHLLISQFPSGVPVEKGNFPARNLTMALLSHATVIVEAGEGSGCLAQAWECVRLGRPLFLLKTLGEDPALKFPSELIRYGAQILSDDTTEELFTALAKSGGQQGTPIV